MTDTIADEQKCWVCEGTGLRKTAVPDEGGMLAVLATVFVIGMIFGIAICWLPNHLTIGWR